MFRGFWRDSLTLHHHLRWPRLAISKPSQSLQPTNQPHLARAWLSWVASAAKAKTSGFRNCPVSFGGCDFFSANKNHWIFTDVKASKISPPRWRNLQPWSLEYMGLLPPEKFSVLEFVEMKPTWGLNPPSFLPSCEPAVQLWGWKTKGNVAIHCKKSPISSPFEVKNTSKKRWKGDKTPKLYPQKMWRWMIQYL